MGDAYIAGNDMNSVAVSIIFQLDVVGFADLIKMNGIEQCSVLIDLNDVTFLAGEKHQCCGTEEADTDEQCNPCPWFQREITSRS